GEGEGKAATEVRRLIGRKRERKPYRLWGKESRGSPWPPLALYSPSLRSLPSSPTLGSRSSISPQGTSTPLCRASSSALHCQTTSKGALWGTSPLPSRQPSHQIFDQLLGRVRSAETHSVWALRLPYQQGGME